MSRRVLTIVLAEATLDLLVPWARSRQAPRVLGPHGARRVGPAAFPDAHGHAPDGGHARHRPFAGASRPHGFLAARARMASSAKCRARRCAPRRSGSCSASAGSRAPILNLPFTYPPPKLKGFMISGEDAPGVHPSIAYPREILKEVTQRFGRYRLKDTFPGGRQKSDYLTLIDEDVRAQTDVFAHLLATAPVGFRARVLQPHRHVPALLLGGHGEQGSRESISRRRRVGAIARSTRRSAASCRPRGPDTNVIVMSDSGAGPLLRRRERQHAARAARLPALSRAAGEREQEEDDVALTEKIRRAALARLRKSSLYFAANHYLEAAEELDAVEPRRLRHRLVPHHRALARPVGPPLHQSEGPRSPRHRRPGGLRQGVRRHRAQARSHRRSAATRSRRSRRSGVGTSSTTARPSIRRPISSSTGATAGYMPNDRDRGETAVFAPRFRQYMSWPTSGSHRLEGVLIAAGPDIEAGTRVHGARLIDIMPTWLQLLGQPVPRELEGKPIYSLLERRKAS